MKRSLDSSKRSAWCQRRNACPPTRPGQLPPQGLSQLAGEGFDGTAGAARELVLPLALRLEATVLQAVAPRLDRLADGAEVQRVALQLPRPPPHVRPHAEDAAE